MITRALILLISVSLCAACSSAPNPDETDTTETPSTMLDVHEVKVTTPDGKPFLTMSADGKVMLQDPNAPMPAGHYTTVVPDGTVTLADGTPFLTLGADGKVTTATGDDTGITIDEDGTMTNKLMPKPLIFDENGHMGEPGDMAMVEHVSGTDNPRSRRAVGLAFISTFIYVRTAERVDEAAMEESAAP